MHAGLYKLELFELYFQMIKTARKSYDPEPNRLCNPCTILFASVFSLQLGRKRLIFILDLNSVFKIAFCQLLI